MTAPWRRRLLLISIISMKVSFALAETTATIAVDGHRRAPVLPDHDDSYVYRLPYGDLESFAVLQGYGSRFSHRGPEYYTVDFDMPEGTLVHSAREGTVIRTEDRFEISCVGPECDRFANFVEIRHPDGTIGKYFHLQRGSVLVEPGEQVERGEPIARSGDTGYSTTPHLHFGVYQPTATGEAQSIAVRFAVRDGFIGQPRPGARYINAAR